MLVEKLKDFRLTLASNSPRRQLLMKEAGLEFELCAPADISEDYPFNMPADEVAQFLAHMKAAYFEGKIGKNQIIITADTVVILEDKVLGKPTDSNDAFNMLNSLSGRRHKVITAICIKSSEKEKLVSSKSDVWFRKLSTAEINYYINEYKPFDKAGAYGIQEWIGYVAVERIEGCFYNIMGLPIQLLYTELEKFIGS